MARRRRSTAASALLLALASWCGSASAEAPAALAPAVDWVWRLPPGFPAPRVPADNPMSASKVELGRRLFYDARLSQNGTQSCASCHRPELAFTDGLGRAVGSTGERHRVGAMSLVNVAYNASFGWASPRLSSLEEQALVPLLGRAPIEMGVVDEAAVLDRLRPDPEIADLGRRAFPEIDRLTLREVSYALASFVRTIVAGRSPYDRYLFDDDRSALSPAARRGMELFFSERVGCSGCHRGFTFGGDLVLASHAERIEPVLRSNGVDGDGVAHDSRRAEDRARFRVPTLRNIERTAPYMHDGRFATLDEVLDHYESAALFAPAHGENRSESARLTEEERADLLDFLQALTDPSIASDPRFGDPRADRRAVAPGASR